MDNLSATQSADLAIRILTGFVNFQSIPMLIIPVGILVYAFKNSISYNKDNSVFYSNIEDQLDKKAFQEIVVPLYSAITANLLTEALNQVRHVSSRDKEIFLNAYETEKQTLLESRDFTLLEASINFQNAIRDIVRSRKNHIAFDELKSNSRLMLVSSTVMSFFALLCGICVVFFQNVFYMQPALNIAFVSWIISMVIIVLLMGQYWRNKITLDNLI